MPIYDVFKKDATKEIFIREDGGAAPAGSVAFGTFTDVEDNTDPNVPFHYIRDLLFNAGEKDPSAWNIKRLATAISADPAAKNLDLSAAETLQIKVSFTPYDVADEACTFVSSDPTKATVNAQGLVTPVAVGATNITVTNTASGKTDVVAITVVA